MHPYQRTIQPPPPRYGLRIENHQIQLAIATPDAQGRYDLTFDQEFCQRPQGWLNAAGQADLAAAIGQLAARHAMRRQRLAVSMDGDFCVTRISMGKPEAVDQEVATLAQRIPRYLQLGPGQKVTGSCRVHLEPTLDYSVTGVANRNVINVIYEAFRSNDLECTWIEPSLVSLARLVGHIGLCQQNPLLIADGTGRQWDVGIVYEGRLLLDYRPAAASTEESFQAALCEHLSRLRRFCQRHRHLAAGDVGQLLICGSDTKSHRAAELFADGSDLDAIVMTVPEQTDVFRTAVDIDPCCVPAIAAVLPMLLDMPGDQVPDLLADVRRAPDRSQTSKFLRVYWPAVAAILFLSISFTMIRRERSFAQVVVQERVRVQSEIESTQVRMSGLAGIRQWLDYLEVIDRGTVQPDWETLIVQTAACLPDQAKLIGFRVETSGAIRLDGIVIEELAVYDIVGSLRKLPSISQVALKATNPETDGSGTRFVIELMLAGNPQSDAQTLPTLTPR